VKIWGVWVYGKGVAESLAVNVLQ